MAKKPCKDCDKKPELQVLHHMLKVCDLNNDDFRANFTRFVKKFLYLGHRQYIHWVPMENTMISGSHVDEDIQALVDKINAKNASLMIGHPQPPPYCPPGKVC